MTTLWRKRIAKGAWLCLLAAGLSCNSDKPGTSASPAKTEIVGAGSTFVSPIMGKWIDDFQRANPQVQINYQSIGSGGGIQQLKKGLLDLGASDAPLSDEQLKDMPPLVQLPETAGPVCITYNLPAVRQQVKLGPATLAGIYLGKIKKWEDPSIARDNPGVKLPDADVVALHRTEGSGTTNLFTTYLDSVSPEWHSKVSKGVAVNWPVGMGGKRKRRHYRTGKGNRWRHRLGRAGFRFTEQLAGSATAQRRRKVDQPKPGSNVRRDHRVQGAAQQRCSQLHC